MTTFQMVPPGTEQSFDFSMLGIEGDNLYVKVMGGSGPDAIVELEISIEE